MNSSRLRLSTNMLCQNDNHFPVSLLLSSYGLESSLEQMSPVEVWNDDTDFHVLPVRRGSRMVAVAPLTSTRRVRNGVSRGPLVRALSHQTMRVTHTMPAWRDENPRLCTLDNLAQLQPTMARELSFSPLTKERHRQGRY